MRLEARFTGRVQGVGFRYITHRIAQHYDVVGFVRNMPDGSVQIVAEGKTFEGTRGLYAFLDEVHDVMSAHVHDQQRWESESTGEFGSFEVRR